MTLYPGDNPRLEGVGVATGSSTGTTVIASATAHVKGAWTQLSASLPFDAAGLSLVGGSGDQFSGVHMLLDIGVGAAGSEVVLVPNIYILNGIGLSLDLPLRLAKGARLAARVQASTVSAELYMAAMLRGRGEWGRPGLLQAVGNADTASSRVTQLTDPGAANTKGAWLQLNGSLPFTVKEVRVDVGPALGAGNADTNSLVDIGLGAAAAEIAVISNIWSYARSFSSAARQGFISFPVNWAKGSRVSARFQSARGNANDRSTYAQVLMFG